MKITDITNDDASGGDGDDDDDDDDDGEKDGGNMNRQLKADDDATPPTTEELRAHVARLRAMRANAARSGDADLIAEVRGVREPRYYADNRLEYTNGDAYAGETVDVVRHGRGTHTCSTGDVYAGGWRDDKRHGFGKITYVSGLTYEGEWVDDKACGKGACAYVNGDAYDGEWRDDHRWGWGTQLFANGDAYEGEWVDDIIEGQGMYTFADGSTYTGSTLSGARVRGRYVAGDGAVEYDGEWRGDARHGRGTFIAVGDMKYIGQWCDDQRHGRGTCEFRDGSSYDGEWSKDAFHGVGVLTTTTHTYTGEFVDGVKHGRGHIAFADNAGEYRGEFARGVEHGQGKRLYADGGRYSGEWRDGRRHGKGACSYANGDEYRGEWRDDRRHGYGCCVFADGTKYRGEWEDDCWCQSTADPLFTKAFGPGVVRAVAGEPTMIGIEARDELKNKRLSGGDVFTVKLTLAGEGEGEGEGESRVTEYGTVTDNGDGTYVAHYTCTVAGEYTCEVLIGANEHCAHSPYDVTVRASRPSAKHCVIVGDGVKRAREGERAEFVVEARDEFDNAVVDDALDRLPLRVSITDVNGCELATVDDGGVRIEDDGHGRLVASYVPARAGYYRLVASANDALIGASPYALRVMGADDDEGDGVNVCANVPEGSIAPKPNDLARDWEIIAKKDYARDGDDFGWDSASDAEEETEAQRLARENPDVPIITNYEDIYKVGRLQKRMKEKRAAEQAAKLADMKAKLEALELAKTSTNVANTKSIDALDL